MTEQKTFSLGDLSLPVMPESMLAINTEKEKEEPDIGKVTNIISHDIGLSAEVLKLVNSAAFGLESKLSSVQHAISLLGLKDVFSCVTSAILRQSIDTSGIRQFWQASNNVANAGAYLASQLDITLMEDAYTAGLFHNCGIPAMKNHFPDYLETLSLQEMAGWDTHLEIENYGFDHTMVGYTIAKQWNLPSNVGKAIRSHHSYSKIYPLKGRITESLLRLITLLKLAEIAAKNAHNSLYPAEFNFSSAEWDEIKQPAADVLEIKEIDLLDLLEYAADSLIKNMSQNTI